MARLGGGAAEQGRVGRARGNERQVGEGMGWLKGTVVGQGEAR